MPGLVTSIYKGIIPLNIRTFTDAYASNTAPWSFSPHTQIPMEETGYTTGIQPNGWKGTIMDSAAGLTHFTVGAPAGAAGSNSFPGFNYNNGRLQGFLTGTGAARYAQWFDVPLNLDGGNHAYPFLTSQVFDTGGGANTGSPEPTSNNNFPTVKGVYTSFEIGLVQGYLQQAGGATIRSNIGFSLGFNAGANMQANLPWKGQNYCKQSLLIHATDFVGTDNPFNVNFLNPPGNFDLNNYWQTGQGQWNITYNGWLSFNHNTVTIDGQVLNGFGILVAGDWSYYNIISITPTDAESVGWNNDGVPTDPDGKFDLSGHLWLKKQNQGNFLFVSTGVSPLYRFLPVFPPIALPDAMPDSEIPLQLFRGTQK